MNEMNKVKVKKFPNFRVFEFNGFENIVFGCPPGIVKEFSRKKEELPAHYVIPIRTFVKGRNNFDFEFIIYSFLFFRKEKRKINIYCTRQQKTRFITILNETLFGPRFKHLLQSQFNRFCLKEKFSMQEIEKMEKFLEKISEDKKLWKIFEEHLIKHVTDRETLRGIAEYFAKRVRYPLWLTRKKIKNLDNALAKGYVTCAQIKKEMDLFGLVTEKGRHRFITNIVDFHILDKDLTVFVPSIKDKRKKIKIVQQRPSTFEIFHKNSKISTIDISHLDLPEKPENIEPIKKPWGCPR